MEKQVQLLSTPPPIPPCPHPHLRVNTTDQDISL